jgi:hypothetical protein
MAFELVKGERQKWVWRYNRRKREGRSRNGKEKKMG